MKSVSVRHKFYARNSNDDFLIENLRGFFDSVIYCSQGFIVSSEFQWSKQRRGVSLPCGDVTNVTRHTLLGSLTVLLCVK